jgi:tripartite ATP-independent transporter DctM subunit
VIAMYERALVPGLLLAACYLVYVAFEAWRGAVPPPPRVTGVPLSPKRCAVALLPPLAIVFCTLGSLFAGVATPTESGAYGVLAAAILAAARRRLTLPLLREAAESTLLVSCCAMFILVGASFFVLPFRGMDGDTWLQASFSALPAGTTGFLVAVSLLVFVLAFFLDFFEIAFIVLPLVMPVARALGVDPAWFAVLLCVVLQTSFMHPPFGIALYNLRSVAPPSVPTRAIYWGAVPFIAIQLAVAAVLIAWPDLAVPLFTREVPTLPPQAVDELLHSLPHPVIPVVPPGLD